MNTPRPSEHLTMIRRDSDVAGDRRGIVCLDRNERPSPWPDGVFREMLAELSPYDFIQYPDLGPLYARLVQTTGLANDRLCVGAGSDALIRRAFQAFVRPGDRVITPDPTYGMYAIWTKIFQGEHIALSYGADLRLDVDGFLAVVSATKPRIVALANADQPTGSMLSRDNVLAVVAACERVGALCIVDEAYHPFSPVTVIGDVRDHSSLLVMRTFSKIGGIAGLRVGYAAGAESVIRALHAVRSPGEVSSVGSVIATYLLDRPELMESYRLAVETGRDLLIATAQELGFTCPKCYGNFQLMRVPAGLTPDDVVAAVKRKGYLIKGGFLFPSLREFVRVTLDGPEIMKPFLQCLRSVCTEMRAGAKDQ